MRLARLRRLNHRGTPTPAEPIQLDALWAIAAALTRLAEVIDAASHPSR